VTQVSRPPAARILWVRVLLLIVMSGCAAKAPPPSLPPTLKYPDFVYPNAVPAAGPQAAAVDRGWRFLQNDDLRSAEREFAAALKAVPGSVPARTGEGYLALARQEYMRALDQFELALRGAPSYAPALVGKGQALLSMNRDADARAAFEAALKADPALVNLGARIDVLKFREIQDLIAEARQAMNAGRLDEARAAYQRALAATPDSAVLYRELGVVQRRQGAEAAYRNAAAADPFSGYDKKAEAVAGKARDARLPEGFQALPSADRITRGDLAALVGIRLEDVLRAAPGTAVVTTDTAGHWAAPWISQVVAAGVIPAFDNHTFQPGAPLRRVDLAEAVSALLRVVARTRPALQARLAARPTVSDMSESHLNYPAVAAAVSAGVLPLLDDGRFDIERPVTGAEAIAAIDRLRALEQSR